MKWMDKCLKSVFGSTVAIKVIIIDNLSTDNTVAFVKEKYPLVELIDSRQNWGFGKANNIGIREAIKNNADYVFLLNQDAYIQPDTIEGLIKTHRKNTSYGIISPMHLNGTGNSLDHNFSICCNVIDCPDLFPDLYLRNIKEIYSITFVNAALWLIPMKCILNVGLFDPFFPHYGEDVDYVNRVKYFGYNIGICPKYTGYHDRESRPDSAKRNYIIRRTMYIYTLKNINKSFIMSILIAFSLLFKHIVISLLKLNFKSLIDDLKISVYLIFSLVKIHLDRQKVKNAGAFI